MTIHAILRGDFGSLPGSVFFKIHIITLFEH
jgi:hypothetical protein